MEAPPRTLAIFFRGEALKETLRPSRGLSSLAGEAIAGRGCPYSPMDGVDV